MRANLTFYDDKDNSQKLSMCKIITKLSITALCIVHDAIMQNFTTSSGEAIKIYILYELHSRINSYHFKLLSRGVWKSLIPYIMDADTRELT